MFKNRKWLEIRSVLLLAAVFTFAGSLPAIVSQIITTYSLPGQLRTDALSIAGICEAAQKEELFSVDIAKQKEADGKEFDRIEDILSQAKLQEVRSSLDVLEHKIDRIRKSLTKEESNAWLQRIDKTRKSIPLKEDSLVNKAVEVLHTQGVDAALQYTQNDLRQHGVSDAKISVVEKRILEEAPMIKQAQERNEIARALKMFENGQLPDSSVDPYIVRTAQLLLKARQDSVKRIEDAKKHKEMEVQERIDRAKMEKEMKEKKIEEERLAKQQKEEDKKKAIEEKAQRKRLEAEEKEKQRQARIDAERQKKMLAKQKDSISLAEKINARKSELERESRLRIEDARERRLQIEEQRQKAQPTLVVKDSGDTMRKSPEQVPNMDKEKPEAAAAEEERMKLNAQQEKAVHDSIEQQQKRQAALLEEERTKQLAEKEKAGKDSIDRQRKAQEAAMSKPSQQPQQPSVVPSTPSTPLQQPAIQAKKNVSTTTMPPPQTAYPAQQKNDTRPPPVLDKSVQAYLQSLKDNQKNAQKKVMEIYDLIEQKQGKAALDKFKQNRAFIGQYVETQVFNVLEQTVMQSVVEDRSDSSSSSAENPAANGGNSKKVSPEQERCDRINNYLRDNNVEAAYAEFKRGEKQLKTAMTKSEFKQLKNMVENAYKMRHPGK